MRQKFSIDSHIPVPRTYPWKSMRPNIDSVRIPLTFADARRKELDGSYRPSAAYISATQFLRNSGRSDTHRVIVQRDRDAERFWFVTR